VLEDTFVEREGVELTLVSDASVHVWRRQVARSWHLFETPTEKRRVVRTVEHQVHAHSYRHELEIFYYALKDAKEMLEHPHVIVQCMDCNGGLTKLEKDIYNPSHTMSTDMDLVLVYKKLIKDSKHTIILKWVLGQAEEKKKAKPTTITPIEHENVAFDEEVNARVEERAAPIKFRPQPGYGTMLQLGGEWVTTHFQECVEFANTAPAMVEYVRGRLDIDIQTFHTINWRAIGRVRASHKLIQKSRTNKMMF